MANGQSWIDWIFSFSFVLQLLQFLTRNTVLVDNNFTVDHGGLKHKHTLISGYVWTRFDSVVSAAFFSSVCSAIVCSKLAPQTVQIDGSKRVDKAVTMLNTQAQQKINFSSGMIDKVLISSDNITTAQLIESNETLWTFDM